MLRIGVRAAATLAVASVALLTAAWANAAGSGATFAFISPGGPASATLSTVSVGSATDAWAVGVQYENQNTVVATLAEHWNGTSWSVSPTVNPGSGAVSGDGLGSSNVFDGVAEVSPTNVWAVGYSNYYSPLIEHFNGASWSQVASGSAPNSLDQTFNAVSAVSPSDLWAVGAQFDTNVGGDDGLIEHFDGTRWSVVPNPETVFDSFGTEHVISPFTSVAAISATNVWAAGPDAGTGQAIFEHFDGSSWSLVPSPQTSSHMYLNALAASGPSDVWAVGRMVGYGRHAPTFQLIEHFNGSSWSIVPGPTAGTGTAGTLYSVTALSSSDVWATGNDSLPSGAVAIQHFDGTRWTVVGVPAGTGFVQGLGSAATNTLVGVGRSASGLGAIISTNA